MADNKMLVQYIRRGWKGRRLLKDGVEFFQQHRGPRIGVMVALNDHQFGWSLVHTKGENREPPKNVSWKKGLEMALERANATNVENVPDSIKKDYEHFKEQARKYFTPQEKAAG